MKVVRLHGVGDLRLHEEPQPLPAPNETLLEVRAVGLCGSDLHWVAEGGIGDAQLVHPLVLGHEFAATTNPASASQWIRRSLAASARCVRRGIPTYACSSSSWDMGRRMAPCGSS